VNFETLKSKLKKANRIFLFLDFDGTLTPIVKTPYKVYLDNSTKKLLKKISKNKNFILGIISGRTIKDLKKRVGLDNILYAGNHGLEIYDKKKLSLLKGLSFKFYQKILKDIEKRIEKKLKNIKGVILENKRVILAIHYRNVAQNKVSYLKRIVKQILSEYVNKNVHLKLGRGKKVIEIRPDVVFNKFLALRFFEGLFKKNKKDITIYAGDDLTDEEVFSKLKKRDIGIRIGRKKKDSSADYFLKSPTELKRFLSFLLELKS